MSHPELAGTNLREEQAIRRDLAAAFRWTVRWNWHEAVANHFSAAVNADGSQFLMNPDRRHFSRIRASDLILIDANDPRTMDRPDAPDATAWGLHGAIHRRVPWARAVLHVHSKYATVLASLADSRLPAIDQNSAMFHNRVVIDEGYGGLALEEEGERIAALFTDPKVRTMVMGNHGVLVAAEDVAKALYTLYLFERSAETYITALSTGQPLRHLSDEIAEKTTREMEIYEDDTPRIHLDELCAILDAEGSDYAD
ncbi:MAG: class II aldolase/adducin family protein [Pseudomonadota bacterium]